MSTSGEPRPTNVTGQPSQLPLENTSIARGDVAGFGGFVRTCKEPELFVVIRLLAGLVGVGHDESLTAVLGLAQSLYFSTVSYFQSWRTECSAQSHDQGRA